MLATATLVMIALARNPSVQAVLSVEGAERLRVWIQGFGPLAPAVFVVVYVLAVVAFVPSIPLTLVGGFVFGPVWGTLYVSMAATGGACLAFFLARHVARGAVERWIAGSPRLRRIDAVAARHGARLVAITRLVPIFPFNLQNYAYGLTGVPFGTYAVTSWLAMLPATAAYTFAGGALSAGTDVRRITLWLGLAGVILAVLILLPRWLARRSTTLADLLAAR